ncbi:MOSC domain-containing protein [Mucilaginibacter terrae]|uniref:Uncharacterized protein YcbX n=1 Tax=Mucilaginibacter terrae TaxID=1955052 RepID=A0ABU3GMP1_9SPHI|nr:MOSC N-terminal beta barrel domain-containing protein [Mucilaginibacter terrae]MDT3401068.1 uncharacterized protein YcbX [Mucilaginibacter terrae]
MIRISELYIYPVKSLGGIALQEAKVTSRGLEHDRRWMLIDDNKQFLSQRKYPQMALFKLQLLPNGIQVLHQPSGNSTIIPYQPQTSEAVDVVVWDDVCNGTYVSAELDKWFSQILNISCRLIHMGDSHIRQVDPRYAGPEHITSFADGYPMLLVSEGSVADLNTRLAEQISVKRFRPNVVITGAEAYHEDRMQHFEVSGINFYGVKPCARCVMIGVNPDTADSGTEPLKTLSSYRRINHKVMFGQNLIHNGTGTLRVGDVVKQLSVGEGLQFSLAANA